MRSSMGPVPGREHMSDGDSAFEQENFEHFNQESHAEDSNTQTGANDDASADNGAAQKTGTKSALNSWMLTGSYFVGWVIILVIFKFVYDRYQAKKRSGKKKWFKGHAEREAYENLLTNKPDDEEALRKALLRRAMTDVKRLWQLQEEKDSLYKLMRAGAIPESLWDDYKDADQELQLEMFDLQAEAETFKTGWSQNILREAAQLVQRERELVAMKAQMEMKEVGNLHASGDPANMTAEEREKLKQAKEKVMKILSSKVEAN